MPFGGCAFPHVLFSLFPTYGTKLGMTVALRHDSLILILKPSRSPNTNLNPNPTYPTNPNAKTWP